MVPSPMATSVVAIKRVRRLKRFDEGNHEQAAIDAIPSNVNHTGATMAKLEFVEIHPSCAASFDAARVSCLHIPNAAGFRYFASVRINETQPEFNDTNVMRGS
jgi:hypothetical protein